MSETSQPLRGAGFRHRRACLKPPNPLRGSNREPPHPIPLPVGARATAGLLRRGRPLGDGDYRPLLPAGEKVPEGRMRGPQAHPVRATQGRGFQTWTDSPAMGRFHHARRSTRSSSTPRAAPARSRVVAPEGHLVMASGEDSRFFCLDSRFRGGGSRLRNEERRGRRSGLSYPWSLRGKDPPRGRPGPLVLGAESRFLPGDRPYRSAGLGPAAGPAERPGRDGGQVRPRMTGRFQRLPLRSDTLGRRSTLRRRHRPVGCRRRLSPPNPHCRRRLPPPIRTPIRKRSRLAMPHLPLARPPGLPPRSAVDNLHVGHHLTGRASMMATDLSRQLRPGRSGGPTGDPTRRAMTGYPRRARAAATRHRRDRRIGTGGVGPFPS
jgi:hypothetical protein